MVEERALGHNGNGSGVAEILGTPREVASEQSIFDTSHVAVLTDAKKPDVVVEDGPDVLKEVETERGATKSNRGRRAVVAVFLFVVVVVTGVICFRFLGVGGGTKKATVPVNKTAAAADSEDAATRQAVQELTGTTAGVPLGDGTSVRPPSSSASPTQDTLASKPVTELPTQGNLTQTAASDKSANTNNNTASDSSTQPKVAAAGRNEERSVRIGEEATVAQPARKDPDSRKPDNKPAGAVVPTFGSMLPIKSLGVIYSLRSGGLARFEVTRDVKGKGWTLPHGTVMVGALRGAEYNRAYISLIGYIDSDSGKFVQVGGDLLGGDGGTGVKGTRRKMSSSWSKVFRRLGEAGLNIAGRAASSIGHGPIIVTDAYGAGQFGNEFNGLLTSKDQNSFVEIPAGTSCYAMITDLPEKVHGVDALARWTSGDLEDKTNTEQRRDATGLSEHELAELLQSGDLEQIRAALPRMSAEMRRVAEAVIAEGSK